MSGQRMILIVVHAANRFDVAEGARICDHLGWDEMLGHVAQLTHPRIGEARYRAMTPAERDEYSERFDWARETPLFTRVDESIPNEGRELFFMTKDGHAWAGQRHGEEWCDWGDLGIICRTEDVLMWQYTPRVK